MSNERSLMDEIFPGFTPVVHGLGDFELTNGEEIIRLIGIEPGDDVFVHEEGMWNVSRIEKHVRTMVQQGHLTARRVDFTQELLEYIETAVTIDHDRVHEYARSEEVMRIPGYIVRLPSGRDLLVDGHHRALAHVVNGRMWMPFFCFNKEQSSYFKIAMSRRQVKRTAMDARRQIEI